MGPQTATLIVLAGGAGMRIRHLHPDCPKPLIPVCGRPFLDWIGRYWAAQGMRRAVISLGHLAEVAERHLADHPWAGLEVVTVREERPLGTGGAVRFAAESAACGDPLVVVNGDSLVFAGLRGAWDLLGRAEVDGVLLGVEVADASRFGSLETLGDGLLAGFREKRPGRGLINAGVYFLKKRLLPWFAGRVPLSLETDVFPALIARGACLHVHACAADFLDMGTPEGLAAADVLLRRHMPELDAVPE